MAVLQEHGRTALAVSVAQRTLHLAWGRGNPAWDSAPAPEPTNATKLVDEIGRREVNDVSFVKPDPAGAIEMPNGDRYTVSADPTTWLLLRATFGFTDAEGEDVREFGVFIDSVIDPAVPPGQRWALAAQVLDGGWLYTLERRPANYRPGTKREMEEVVLAF
ncbi:MAG: hypothetical protein FWG56_12005 [Desulfovibrionaceae bacterium]|jgi:hypothetical protein|nr:hypothetical protein [Desulfovibrionaceae bacterium]